MKSYLREEGLVRKVVHQFWKGTEKEKCLWLAVSENKIYNSGVSWWLVLVRCGLLIKSIRKLS